MNGFEYAQSIHDNLAELDTDGETETDEVYEEDPDDARDRAYAYDD